MTPSEPSSKTPSAALNPAPFPRKLALASAALGLLGFLDAMYLTAEHYLRLPVPCTAGFNCETVLTSSYAHLGPFPVSLFGVFYYGAVFLLSFSAMSRKNAGLLRAVAGLVALGFLATLVFVYLQLFVIRAVCLYCMISAATTTALLGVSLGAKKAWKTSKI